MGRVYEVKGRSVLGWFEDRYPGEDPRIGDMVWDCGICRKVESVVQRGIDTVVVYTDDRGEHECRTKTWNRWCRGKSYGRWYEVVA